MRGKDYQLLDQPEIKLRLQLPPDQQSARKSARAHTLPPGPHRAGVCACMGARAASTGRRRLRAVLHGAWCSICIVEPLKMLSATKTWNRIQIAGVLMHLWGRSAGRSSPNGSGISASNWATSSSRRRCEPPRRAPALAPAKDATAPASGYARAEVALPFKAGRFSGRGLVLRACWHAALPHRAEALRDRKALRS